MRVALPKPCSVKLCQKHCVRNYVDFVSCCSPLTMHTCNVGVMGYSLNTYSILLYNMVGTIVLMSLRPHHTSTLCLPLTYCFERTISQIAAILLVGYA